MLKQLLVGLAALIFVMLAISLAVGSLKLPSPVTPTPSPTVSSPISSPIASPSATVTPTPTPTATPTPAPSFLPTPLPRPFTISGRGPGDSQTFQLPDLVYELSYSLGGSCQYQANLNQTDATLGYSWLQSRQGDGPNYPVAGPSTGAYHLFLQVPGTFVVEMTTNAGCPWSVTFTAQ